MKQPGRKSANSLVVADASVHLIQRPAPPDDFTVPQRLHWVEISNALPAEWFGDENKALLGEYCRTLTTLEFLNQQIDRQESLHPERIDSDIYFELLKRRESMVRISLAQATKMRLSQQSRYGARGADGAVKKQQGKGSPWLFGG
jgi:hypothetical protein